MNTTRSKNNRLLSFFLCCIMLCAMPSLTNANEALSPMPQSITQSTTPDYIAQAQAGVKKYYPQYENYFKEIINKIKRIGGYEEYLINDEINDNLVISGDELNEKEKTTIILIALEIINGKENFRREQGITNEDRINEIATDIKNGFGTKYKKTIKDLDDFKNDNKILNSKMSTEGIDKIGNEFITTSEKYMASLKDLLINYGQIKTSKNVQEWIGLYIVILRQTGKTPSRIGQKYIDEYNKIKKQ